MIDATHAPDLSPASLDACYRQLDAAVQSAYRRLSHHPGPQISIAAAAAMLSATQDETENLFQGLRQHGLLERAVHGWRMPDPVRVHAQALADQHDDPTDSHAAQARAAQTYLEWTAHLDTVIDPDRDRYAGVYAHLPRHAPDTGSAAHAIGLIAAWTTTLLAAQSIAAHLGLHHVAWQYGEALTGYLTATTPGGAAEAWRWVVDVAVDSAERCGDLGARARLHALAAQRERALERHREAISHLAEAARLARRTGDSDLEATTLAETGAALLDDDQPKEALNVLQAGLALHDTLPERLGRRARFGRGLALAHTRLGDDDLAATYYQAAERTAVDLADPDLLAQLSAGRAEMALRRGQTRTALDLVGQAETWSASRAPIQDASLHCLAAAAHEQAGDLNAARERLHLAEQLAVQAPCPDHHQVLQQIAGLHNRLSSAREGHRTADADRA